MIAHAWKISSPMTVDAIKQASHENETTLKNLRRRMRSEERAHPKRGLTAHPYVFSASKDYSNAYKYNTLERGA
jgi:hypothetical protein